jgi:hypothetical protein
MWHSTVQRPPVGAHICTQLQTDLGSMHVGRCSHSAYLMITTVLTLHASVEVRRLQALCLLCLMCCLA